MITQVSFLLQATILNNNQSFASARHRLMSIYNEVFRELDLADFIYRERTNLLWQKQHTI
jgi:hypothetical protein